MMQRITSIAFTLMLFCTLIVAVSAKQKSLYERLGGATAISAIVDDFVVRIAADSRVNLKFAKSNIERVKFHLKEQVCAVTGGPCKYTGNSMTAAHKHMKVTEGEFNALVENLVATLDKFKVPEQEKSEVLTALGGLKSQIVEVKGDATGTPLPPDFKPAPALSSKSKKEKPKQEKLPPKEKKEVPPHKVPIPEPKPSPAPSPDKQEKENNPSQPTPPKKKETKKEEKPKPSSP